MPGSAWMPPTQLDGEAPSARQGHPRTRRSGELSSTWDLLKDVAATAPDVQGSIQPHQVEVPGFQQRPMSSALASSRAGLNSPLHQSAPQCCCSCSQSRGHSHRVPAGTRSRNTQKLSLVTTAQHLCVPPSSAGGSQQDLSSAPVTGFQLFPLLFSLCDPTPPRYPR